MATLITISKATAVYEFDSKKIIKVGMTTDDLDYAKKQIEKKIKRFESACNAAVLTSGKNADTVITDAIEDGKQDILISAIDKQFEEKFKREIRRTSSYNALLKLIENIVGVITDVERVSNATRELENCTRRINDNEKFEQFTERLQIIAADIDKDEKIQQYLVKKEFKRNLSPVLKVFLVDHGQDQEDIMKICLFLDSKQKHVKVISVNAVESKNDIQKLEAKIEALTTLFESSLQMQKQLTNAHAKFKQSLEPGTQGPKMQEPMYWSNVPNYLNDEYEVNKVGINTKPPNAPVQRFRQNTAPMMTPPRTLITAESQGNWIYNKFGKPVRCGTCGMFGHYARICPGTCKEQCFICKQVGHLQSVCKQRPQQLSKN